MEKRQKIFLVIGIIIAILVLVQIVIFYLIRKNGKDTTDVGSTERATTLEHLMRSYFGNNWPVVFGGILLCIFIILILLFFIFKKAGNEEIEISPGKQTVLTVGATVYFIIFSLFTVFLFVKMLKDENNNTKETNDQRNNFLKIAGLVLAAIFGILIILALAFYIFHKKKAS